MGVYLLINGLWSKTKVAVKSVLDIAKEMHAKVEIYKGKLEEIKKKLI